MSPLRINISIGERIINTWDVQSDQLFRQDIGAEGPLVAQGTHDPYPEDIYEVQIEPEQPEEKPYVLIYVARTIPTAHFSLEGNRRVDLQHVPSTSVQAANPK